MPVGGADGHVENRSCGAGLCCAGAVGGGVGGTVGASVGGAAGAAVEPGAFNPAAGNHIVRQVCAPGRLQHPADVELVFRADAQGRAGISVRVKVYDEVGMPAANAADASPVVTDVLPTPP